MLATVAVAMAAAVAVDPSAVGDGSLGGCVGRAEAIIGGRDGSAREATVGTRAAAVASEGTRPGEGECGSVDGRAWITITGDVSIRGRR